MSQTDERDRRIADLQERLKRLSEAGRQINESLDLDLVLSRVLDSARALTDARYAIIVTLTADGQIEDHLVSGMTEEESQALAEMTDGLRFFEYLSAIPGPLRVDNFAAHAAALNLPEFLPPVEASALLAVPVRHQGVEFRPECLVLAAVCGGVRGRFIGGKEVPHGSGSLRMTGTRGRQRPETIAQAGRLGKCGVSAVQPWAHAPRTARTAVMKAMGWSSIRWCCASGIPITGAFRPIRESM